MTTTLSLGTECSSAASRRWSSFQTRVASGRALTTPLVVRWSQLPTPKTEGTPIRRAALTVSVCRRFRLLRPISGETKTTSGRRSASAEDTLTSAGTNRSRPSVTASPTRPARDP